MGIQRYVFFSIHNAERHPEVPLMLIKSCSEKFLESSGLDYTIFRLCGFMQARPSMPYTFTSPYTYVQGTLQFMGESSRASSQPYL
jgi:hypothetical protein